MFNGGFGVAELRHNLTPEVQVKEFVRLFQGTRAEEVKSLPLSSVGEVTTPHTDKRRCHVCSRGHGSQSCVRDIGVDA